MENTNTAAGEPSTIRSARDMVTLHKASLIPDGKMITRAEDAAVLVNAAMIRSGDGRRLTRQFGEWSFGGQETDPWMISRMVGVLKDPS